MKRTTNHVREKLKEGKLVTGGVIYSFSSNIMEAAGHAGLDFMRIDLEHAWRRDESLENMCRAAELTGILPIVRVDRDDPYLVRKVLEVGAGGVLMPDCKAAAEAEAFVRAAKFPPNGERGYSSICRSGGWGTAGGESWVKWSDTEPLIGIMIENVESVKNVESIAAVNGIDFLLFGSADLSMSMGLGKPVKDHPEIVTAKKKTVAAARANGLGMMQGVGFEWSAIQRQIESGVTMLEMSSDVVILNKIWQGNVEMVNSKVQTQYVNRAKK